MTDLKIDGETFRVEVEGDADKPVVMLSNSLGTDLSLWDAQMPALGAHFRVVRYDPRGHGRSTSVGAPYSLRRLGADALAILDALSIRRVHFVGISMGGAVGQWLLVNAPERVDRAVLANTSARFGAPEIWNGRIRTVLSQGTQALAAAAMERWFSAGFRASGVDDVAAIERVFRTTSDEGYAACCAALRDMDMREALRAVDRPVLIVTGRDDPVASAADIATMMTAVAGARHVELDCKHISNVEAQAAFDAAVVGFLTTKTPRAAKPRGIKPRETRKPATRRLAGRPSAARSPLKPAAARMAPGRPRATEKPARTAAKPRPLKAAAKKSIAKKTATKKPAARTVAAKKAAARKPKIEKTSAAKKIAARKRSAKPVGSALSRPPAKATTKRSTSKQTPTKKGAARKTSVRRPTAKPRGRRR